MRMPCENPERATEILKRDVRRAFEEPYELMSNPIFLMFKGFCAEPTVAYSVDHSFNSCAEDVAGEII